MTPAKRIRNILSANISDILEKSADPEKKINQLIREMDHEVLKIRRHTASAISNKKIIERKLTHYKDEINKCLSNTEAAIDKNDDNLALKNLRRKKELEENIHLIENQFSEANELVTTLKNELQMIEERIQEFRAKNETLNTKKRLAEMKEKMLDTTDRVTNNLANVHGSANQLINEFDSLEKMEENIDLKIAELEARKELRENHNKHDLEKPFRNMQKEESLKEELNDLKKKNRKKN